MFLKFNCKPKKEITEMKKLLILPFFALGLVGCGNHDMLDFNHTFHYAVTRWPDGSMKKIEIKQWAEYLGEQKIQIISTDGNIYLLSMNNTVLVREGK